MKTVQRCKISQVTGSTLKGRRLTNGLLVLCRDKQFHQTIVVQKCEEWSIETISEVKWSEQYKVRFLLKQFRHTSLRKWLRETIASKVSYSLVVPLQSTVNE